MHVKVCGLTDMDQLGQLEDLDVAFAGFIFYPPSPRYALKRGLQGPDVKRAGLKAIKVVYSWTHRMTRSCARSMPLGSTWCNCTDGKHPLNARA